MSSRRPLAVYSAKRRQRSISNPHTRPSSSPVKQLDLHDGDLSIAEMSRRMMKKSRASLKRSSLGLDGSGSRSAGASPIDPPLDNTRPTKKSRTVGAGPGPRKPLETIVEPNRNRSIVPTECGTMDMDLTGVAEIKTPAPREVPVPNDAHICEESDFLSPLPTPHHARCVIAHGNSSNQLKENKTKAPASSKNNIMLLSPAPQSLASPFHSRPATPNSSRSRIAAKKASANKTLNRTRSVGTDLRRRATMRSYSRAVSPASDASGPALQRHPSLPTSQSLKRQEQDWLVRAQPDQTQTRKSPAKIAEPAVPFVRESSFFKNTPQACSTPGPTAKTFRFPQPTPKLPADVNATPRLPLLFKTKNKAANSNNLSLLDGPTPRARPAHEGPSLAFLTGEDSLFSGSDVLDPSRDSSDVNQVATQALQDAPVQKTRRRMTVHLSQDSIFSSALDFSTSVTVKQPSASSRPPDVSTLSDNTLTEAAVESATIVPAALASPTSSDGDELRDMFSILGLDGLSSLFHRCFLFGTRALTW